MGCACPQRENAAERAKKEDEGAMGQIRRRKSSAHESGKVVLHLEGLECICPTDPTGDNLMLIWVLGISVCAISGGVFGTFVPKAGGFDEMEPLCTAAAATIFTVLFDTIWESNGFKEREEEEIVPTKEVNGVVIRGVMLGDLFNLYQEEGQIVPRHWDATSGDQIIFKVNEEVILGVGTNLFHSLEMQNGTYIPIGKKIEAEENGFRFELEEWDFMSDNNKLIPTPAGIYGVNSLEKGLDFSKGSKTPGLYFVSTSNKSIYVLYGRLEIEA